MTIKPTPFTAALAGVVAALAWPLMWSRWGGAQAAGSMELIVATLLVIALPAHVFVVGLGRAQEESGGSPVNMALLKRIGVWLAAGVGTAVLRGLAGV